MVPREHHLRLEHTGLCREERMLDPRPLQEFLETPSITASGLHVELMMPRSGIGMGVGRGACFLNKLPDGPDAATVEVRA